MVVLPYMVVLFDIIARLPAKVVTQCKLVCTDWLDMLSSEEFAMRHSQYMRRSDDQKIIITSHRTCKVRSLDHKSPNYSTATNVHILFAAKPHNLLFLASLDGMLCVCLKNTCELVVWNPLTSVYKMLSNSNS